MFFAVFICLNIGSSIEVRVNGTQTPDRLEKCAFFIIVFDVRTIADKADNHKSEQTDDSYNDDDGEQVAEARRKFTEVAH